MDSQELSDTGIFRIQQAARAGREEFIADLVRTTTPRHVDLLKHAVAIGLITVLSGCATMERHPIATAVIVGIAAGSIAASTNHRAGRSPDVSVQEPDCAVTSCL